MLLGSAAMEKLAGSRVAVFGIGGVGGFACEAMVRSGIGAFDLIDNDTVSLTNLNRQIIALHSTIGRYKVDVMRERMLDINPAVCVRTYSTFVLPENVDEFPFSEYDYIVDAVDTVTAKVQLAVKAAEYGVPIICCMGAGNKLDGSQFKVADIYETKYCPLAKVMRHEMKKRGIRKLKVVYSEEPALRPLTEAAAYLAEDGSKLAGAACGASAGTYAEKDNGIICESGGRNETDSRLYSGLPLSRRSVPGSTAFVPSMAGLLIGGEVVKDLVREELL